MSTYSETVFNLRTTTVNGIELPMKKCGDIDFNFWSYVVDDMVEHIRYFREDFVVRDTDVFICTFPRSGTNWTHEIVQMVLKKSAEFAPMLACFENLSHEALQKLPSPRVLGTHLPFRFLPPKMTKVAKIVCVFRNPKDVAVSQHNYIRHINFLDYKATWDDYYQLFINGDVPCGNWFDHVQDWERVVKEYKTSPILTLKYEDMKENLSENVSRIADFLGVELGNKLTAEISDKCEFFTQYKERTTNVHEVIAKLTKDTPNFLYRKGEVGEWKNWFTVAQSEEFDKIYQEKMKNSDLNLRFI